MGNPAYTPPDKRELIRREIIASPAFESFSNKEELDKLLDSIMNIVEPQKADVVTPTPTEEN